MLLRRSSLREGREASEVAEQAGDVGAVAGKKLLSVVRGEQAGDLWRDESRELGALPLDRLKGPRIGDRDRRLVGECLDELDVVISEEARTVATESDRTDQLP